MHNKARMRQRVSEKENKVRRIMDIMVAGQYITHLTPQKLAAEWQQSVKMVQGYAGEAARRIRAEVHGNPEIRGRIIAMLEVIGAQAISKGDRRNAVEALRLLSYITGAAGGDVSPSATNVTVNVAPGARIDSVVLDAMYGPPRVPQVDAPPQKQIGRAHV